MTCIHSTAIIDPKANLAEDVEVGPYSVIGPEVNVDQGTVIGPHVVLKGPLTLGKQNKIYQFASVGEACQDKKYKGEPTGLEIGDHNVIRESVTLQRGTVQDRGMTTIGSHNLFMAYSHVGHDCVVGDHVVFANSATLAGHVSVGDGAILGGFTGVHQFSQVGAYAMTAMFSAVNKDVPAYLMVQGNMAKASGLNIEGMKRRQMDKSVIKLLQHAYRVLYRQGLIIKNALAVLDELYEENPRQELKLFIDSVRASKRGIIR